MTHTETLPDEVFRQKIDLFNMFVKQNLDIFVAPYKYWLEQAIPTHLIRFEDLLQRPVETLRSLFEFLLDEPSLVGTALEARIKQVGSFVLLQHQFCTTRFDLLTVINIDLIRSDDYRFYSHAARRWWRRLRRRCVKASRRLAAERTHV